MQTLETIAILELSTVMGGEDPRAGGMFENNAGTNREYIQGEMDGEFKGPVGTTFKIKGGGQYGTAESDVARCMVNPKTTDPTKCLPQVQTTIPATKSP